MQVTPTLNLKTAKPAGTHRDWFGIVPCRAASDQEICSWDARAAGLCGTLMAQGLVCIEIAGHCPVHGRR